MVAAAAVAAGGGGKMVAMLVAAAMLAGDIDPNCIFWPILPSGGSKVALTLGPSHICYKMGLTFYIYFIQIIFFKNRM